MIVKISMETEYRALFISDIHGNLTAIKSLLENNNYQRGIDYLFILGDIIEKGKENIATLRYVMDLASSNRCYVVVGNCDWGLHYLLDEKSDRLKEYMHFRQDSIFHDMAKLLDYDVTIDFDTDDFVKEARKVFFREKEFIEKLPSIIESDDFIVTHAGLYPNDDYRDTDFEYALSYDYQGLVDYKYPKPLIVGHWASVLYQERFIVNPYMDFDKNILSIDGANSIKNYGQLNALIVNKKDGQMNFSYDTFDRLKRVKTKSHQVGSTGVKLAWPYNKIVDIKEDGLFVCGYQQRYGGRGYREEQYTPKCIRTPRAFIYQYKGEYYSYEYGNYFLEIPVGATVGIVLDNNNDFTIIKYNGEVGLIERRHLDI